MGLTCRSHGEKRHERKRLDSKLLTAFLNKPINKYYLCLHNPRLATKITCDNSTALTDQSRVAVRNTVFRTTKVPLLVFPGDRLSWLSVSDSFVPSITFSVIRLK
jgi:hypothetical protein